jgi:hypothetical protein
MDLEEQINFTNKLKHPTNNRKVVYRFWIKEQADYFSSILTSESIEFESQVDEEDERKPTYFGVARALEKKVDRLNYIALGKNRGRFIASPPIRWIILGLSFLAIAIAILGAILSE